MLCGAVHAAIGAWMCESTVDSAFGNTVPKLVLVDILSCISSTARTADTLVPLVKPLIPTTHTTRCKIVVVLAGLQ